MSKSADNTFHKGERLSSKKQTEQLFSNGRSLNAFPLRIQYLLVPPIDQFQAKVLFSVPKKRFKLAVKRNLIRRKIREAYRVHKSVLYKEIPDGVALVMAVIYVDNEIPDYKNVEKAVLKAFEKLKLRLKEATLF